MELDRFNFPFFFVLLILSLYRVNRSSLQIVGCIGLCVSFVVRLSFTSLFFQET